jgi:prepilin-type N-terminal cleavage/methylation domain-containing protein
MESKLHELSFMGITSTIKERKRKSRARPLSRHLATQAGFSMVELSVVTIIALILAGMAVPALMTTIRTAHLRGAASDYAGLLELARIYAIRDNNYYATYILSPVGTSPVAQAYIDLPQGSPPAKNGGTGVVTGDPTITITSEVVVEPVGSAPNTSNLESQLLPATTPVTPTDTSVTAATFGPRGLPCTPLTLSSSVVCDSSGGATAYWTFLKNTKTGAWQAVTITPAGRIKKWFYTGTVWSKL